MGKNKDSGRSKTRPSSSSLAASLLTSGVSNVGFGGYRGASPVDTPSVEEASSSFTVFDSELSQHLKRLSRKDSITKLKALTALHTLFNKKNAEDIVQIIPQWAFEYKRLLNDYNREVRRATHETMTALVISVGKGLGPHFKSLMGPWWFGQFDQVSEISQAARRSFEAAFPVQEKRLDGLIISSNEILHFLDENLKLTPQAMSDKITPKDELEEMYQHVLSSSLLAIATLLDILVGVRKHFSVSEVINEPRLVSKSRIDALSYAENMFHTHSYFLEFLTSSSPRVRSATYSVFGSFVKHIPQAFNEENLKKLSTAILGSLQEKDPSCHSPMWDMILLFSRRFQDSWSVHSIQKKTMTHMSKFLRHECYGSQGISYPVLVLFLDSLPAKMVVGEHFASNFFISLWTGRNPFHAQTTNRSIFFEAFKECFLWAIHKASRYVSVEDQHNFQERLIDNVLVKLLWGDYLSLVTGNCHDSSGKSSGSIDDRENKITAISREEGSRKYPSSYLQDLGKCIIAIVSAIFAEDNTLLSIFFSTFQKDCREVFQQTNCLPRSSHWVEQIVNFFLLLDQLAVVRSQTWPLYDLAGPLVAKSLPLIKSLDSEDVIRLLHAMVEIFGPRIIVLNSFLSQKGQYCYEFIEECMKESSTACFLQVFEDEFIPWCLNTLSHSSSSKLDLLIELLDDKLFYEQWHSVIEYATTLLNCSENKACSSDIGQITLLTMLLEKVQKRKEIRKKPINQNGSFPEHWQHNSLDLAATSVAWRSSTNSSHASFIKAAIGCPSEDQICFISEEALLSIFQTVLRNLTAYLATSSHIWVVNASSLLLSSASLSLSGKDELSKSKKVEMAQFSIKVLDGSISRLRKLNGDYKLLPCILAAIFLIEWNVSMQDASGSLDERITDPQDEVDAEFSLGKTTQNLRSKVDINFWHCIDSTDLNILRNTLTLAIRSAIVELNTHVNDRIPALGCSWALDMLRVICRNPEDEQVTLDALLSENEYWPIWVSPVFNTGSTDSGRKTANLDNYEPRHCQFVSFVDKLVSSLGVGKVVAGCVSDYHAVTTQSSSLSSSSRSWVAAEVLCTWVWQGGSVFEYLLPLLSEYAKNVASSNESILFSIITMLLDNAIIHGASCQLIFFNVWTASDDETESIKDPYLRGLISLLRCLIVKDCTWKRSEAILLFDHVLQKLFLGTSINRSCLRVLPFLLNIISQPLLKSDSASGESSEYPKCGSSDIDSVRANITSWLQTALSLPSLASGNTQGQDLEEWIQVIVSCYPLSATGAVGSFQVAEIGEISQLEKILLLNLLRKQRSVSGISSTSNFSSSGSSLNLETLPLSAQMMLVKLTAVSVGYCWREFNDDDWDFVLGQVRIWMGSSVLVLEELAEKVDDAVTGSSLQAIDIVDKLKLAIHVLDPLPLNILKTTLITLSLFSRIFSSNEIEDNILLPSFFEKWAYHKNEIFEDVLRLFFARGATEAIARSFSEEAELIISKNWHAHYNLWDLVATCVISSPHHVRSTAIRTMELWGLSVGAVASIYALLFPRMTISSLQLAAYNVISTESICENAIFREDSSMDQYSESSLEESIKLREELSSTIENPEPELLDLDFLAIDRINYFIGWALLLSYLQSLSPSSPARLKVTQYVQDAVSSKILDCIFQHIPLKPGSLQYLKKKDAADLPIELSKSANSARRAISSCSLSFAIESLWPVETEEMAVLAGSIYGSMIHLLPAYVRNWFTSLRDRSLSSAIESFTRIYCSPPLIAYEFSQMKVVDLVDDNFSVAVNKSAHEIIATYKKEETGMDLIINLPSSYPLRPVDVDCTRSLGISEVKQRKWLLSMTAFVRNQNGAIAEAIRIWKRNFNKEFQGVEECPICYSIIHTANHSLPRLPCKTCKHKFHSACLFKWFSTSNKSTCPLCQMPF